MKFYTMVKAVENKWGFPPKELLDGIDKLGQEASKAGVFVSMGGFLPTSAGAEVRLTAKGDIKVTDGPFAEAREVVGGWAVYDVKSKAEAIEWARKFLDLHTTYWPGFECTIEIRQVMDFTPPPGPAKR